MQDFEELYEQYMTDVYRFLLKLSGNPDVAEELTQSTFAIAFENLSEFRGECKITVWLCQIAKHEYYAFYKKRKPLVSADAVTYSLHNEGLEQEVINRAEGIRIHEVLHELPEPYKEVFTLRVMAELSYKDISRLFKKSESWARVTYYRAKQMIVRGLGGEDDVKM